MRDWYQNEHANWVSIDGERSKWWVWNRALDAAKHSVVTIQVYLQKISDGMHDLHHVGPDNQRTQFALITSCFHLS